MNRAFAILVAFVACCMQCLPIQARAAAPEPIELPAGVARVEVWPGVRVVTDPERRLTPAQAAERVSGSAALRVDSPDRVLGRATVPHWALFSLRNQDANPQQRLLALEATTQFDVQLFERSGAREWQRVRSLAESAEGRLGEGTTHPVWIVQLGPHQASEMLLRVEGPSVVRFPLFAHSPVSFAGQGRTIHVVAGLALGSCLLIIAFLGWPRREFDDKSVPLFVCMIVADVVGALWLTGFLSEAFPGVSERTLSSIGIAAITILYGCGYLHVRIYLNISSWAPRFDRLLLALGLLWLFLAPWFSIAFPVGARLLLIWGGTPTALILLAASLFAARRRIPHSMFIGVAWFAYLVLGYSFLLSRFSNDPRFWTSSTMFLLRATLVAILFGLAMSQRLVRQRALLVASRQEALLRAENASAITRERSRLFAATSHDLRQPMLGVGVFAELLKSASTPAEREEYARKLDTAIEEVDGLLVGIQQLSVAHDAAQGPALALVKVHDLLTPIVEEYRGRAKYKHVAIRYVPARLTIRTNAPYFQRIVRNALSNAVRYTDFGNRILIGFRRGGGVRLVILDTGRGMTEAQALRAFDVFQRFEPANSVPDGFGLGLYSVKVLADALGMSVSLHSQSGRGTEFRLFMPSPA